MLPQAAGWYPDPEQPGTERYWFGQQWSNQTRPAAMFGGQNTQRPAVRTPGAIPEWVPWAAMAAGGVLMILGSLTTWVTASVGGFLNASGSGINDGGDGWLTFGLGVCVIAAGALLALRWGKRVLLIGAELLLSVASVAFCIYEVIHLSTLPTSFTSGSGADQQRISVHVTIGGGLVLALVASLVAAVGGVIGWRLRDAP